MFNKAIKDKIEANQSFTSEENATIIEDIVNDCSWRGHAVGKRLARIHRYLQQEFFKTCLTYIIVLAKNYEDGIYDGRNEWACKYAKLMLDGIRNAEPDYAEWLIRYTEEQDER